MAEIIKFDDIKNKTYRKKGGDPNKIYIEIDTNNDKYNSNFEFIFMTKATKFYFNNKSKKKCYSFTLTKD